MSSINEKRWAEEEMQFRLISVYCRVIDTGQGSKRKSNKVRYRLSDHPYEKDMRRNKKLIISLRKKGSFRFTLML